MGNRKWDDMLMMLLKEQADHELMELDVLVDSESIHVFSERFERWLTNLIAKTEMSSAKKRKYQQAMKWSAAVLVVVLIMLSVLLVGNEEIQAKMKNFFFQWKNGNYEWKVEQSGEKNETNSESEKWLKKEPVYIPEGYVSVENIEGTNFRIYSYQNEDGYNCSIHINLYSSDTHHTYGFDNEHSVEKVIKENGYVFDFFESTDEEYPSYLFYQNENESGSLIIIGYFDWKEFYRIFEEIIEK